MSGDNWIAEAIRARCRRRIAVWLIAIPAATVAIIQVYFFIGSEKDRPALSTAAIVLAILAVLIALVARYEWRTFRAAFDPVAHATYRRVLSWGDIEGTATAIARESHVPRFKALRGWRVTDTFLIQSHFFTFDVFRYERDVWSASAGKTWYRRYHTLPIPFLQAFHEVKVRCKERTLHLEGTQRNSESILEFMKQRPWFRDILAQEGAGLRRDA